MGTTFIENVGNKKGSFLKKQETQFQKQVSFWLSIQMCSEYGHLSVEIASCA